MEVELHREKYRSRYSTVLGSTVCALVVAAVLVATLWMPVLQIYGSSMTPSLQDGEIVLSVKDAAPETGEIIAFYYNNKVLVKRVIGGSEDKIFVLGDHRSVSVDSRNVAIGCVSEDQIVGQILFRVWPLGEFGTVK